MLTLDVRLILTTLRRRHLNRAIILRAECVEQRRRDRRHRSAQLLLHYAGNDERINAGIPDYEAALKANNKPYEIYIYEGANHAFNNDTNAARYHEEAAKLAIEKLDDA